MTSIHESYLANRLLLAMPAPTKVPTTRNQWIKEHERLEKKRDKTGLPVKLVPNFSMDADDFAEQALHHQWDKGNRRGWLYADPVEYEGKGVPGIAHRQKTINHGGRDIPINYLIHHGDEGQINSILSHFPEGTPYEKPGSITVTVHPSYRGKGIGSTLVNHAQDKFGIDLDQQEYTPLGYEMYRNVKRQRGENVPNIFKGKEEELDEKVASIHESYAERQRLAMAWGEWKDKIQHHEYGDDFLQGTDNTGTY